MNEALKIIREFEGLSLKAYPPPEGTARGWAIGYGYTRSFVTKDCVISEAWAENLLREELKITAVMVKNLTEKIVLTSNQFEALLSLTYNIGVGNFKESTLLKKLKRGDFSGAAEEFLRWNRFRGLPSKGLLRRRQAEKNLFQSS